MKVSETGPEFAKEWTFANIYSYISGSDLKCD